MLKFVPLLQQSQNDKYDLIVQKDAAPFTADTLDVTDKVIKEIK